MVFLIPALQIPAIFLPLHPVQGGIAEREIARFGQWFVGDQPVHDVHAAAVADDQDGLARMVSGNCCEGFGYAPRKGLKRLASGEVCCRVARADFRVKPGKSLF